MKRFLFVAIVGSLLLTACQAGPAPTPTETAATEPTTEPTAVPTVPPTWTPTPPPPPTPADTPTPAATATPVPADVWVNATAGLNLRAEAKADAKLVAILKDKQHLVSISLAAAPDAGGITWQNVRADDGQTGWVSAQFLTTTNPAGPTAVPTAPAPTAPAPAASTGEVWVTATNGLNLRAQAATTSTLMALLPFGTHLALTSAPTGPDAAGITWHSVRTDDGKIGFVAAAATSPTKPATPTPTVVGAAPVTATAAVTSSGVSVSSMANDILQRLNALRVQNGLQPVALNSALTAAALRHSQDMAKTGNIAHTGSDGTTAEQRMRAAGFTGGTGEEAIYGGRATVDDAWYFWTTDRTHANMLLKPEYTVVGVAVVNAGDRTYYTLDFGKP